MTSSLRSIQHFLVFAIKPYPDRALCFWLGFIASGSIMSWWVLVITELLDEVFQQQPVEDYDQLAIKTFFIYAIPAAIGCLFAGRILKNFKVQSDLRWLWLSFIIPQIAIFITMNQVVFMEGHPLELLQRPLDTIIAVSLYGTAALAFSLLLACVIGLYKFLTSIQPGAPTAQ